MEFESNYKSSYKYKSKKDSRGSYLGESILSCMATDSVKTVRFSQETVGLILSDGSGEARFPCSEMTKLAGGAGLGRTPTAFSTIKQRIWALFNRHWGISQRLCM